jgi:hypothetical protein
VTATAQTAVPELAVVIKLNNLHIAKAAGPVVAVIGIRDRAVPDETQTVTAREIELVTAREIELVLRWMSLVEANTAIAAGGRRSVIWVDLPETEIRVGGMGMAMALEEICYLGRRMSLNGEGLAVLVEVQVEDGAS